MSTEESTPIETEKAMPPGGKVVEVNAPPPRQEESSFDHVGMRREMATQAARDAGLELEHLKKLLSAQDAAKLHAQSVAAQLQKELRSLESDNSRLRAELKRLQDQVAFAKQESNIELRRAADREEALRKELIELRSVATKALEKVSGSRKWLTISLGFGVPALILAAVIYLHPAGVSAGTRDQAQDDSMIAESANPQLAEHSKPAAKPVGHDFAAGLGRLDDALNSFRGEKPEDVLQRIHLQNAAKGISVCSFEWNNGDPTMEFGSKEGMDLNASMTRCADAVEKAAK
jgi:DNA-binding transcriptional MerR regulator